VPGCPQRRDGGVQVAAVPQGHRVQHETEGAELVFLALAVGLVDLPAPAVADGAGQVWRDSWTVSCRFMVRR
jgi:hypothetical protein